MIDLDALQEALGIVGAVLMIGALVCFSVALLLTVGLAIALRPRESYRLPVAVRLFVLSAIVALPRRHRPGMVARALGPYPAPLKPCGFCGLPAVDAAPEGRGMYFRCLFCDRMTNSDHYRYEITIPYPVLEIGVDEAIARAQASTAAWAGIDGAEIKPAAHPCRTIVYQSPLIDHDGAHGVRVQWAEPRVGPDGSVPMTIVIGSRMRGET